VWGKTSEGGKQGEEKGVGGMGERRGGGTRKRERGKGEGGGGKGKRKGGREKKEEGERGKEEKEERRKKGEGGRGKGEESVQSRFGRKSRPCRRAGSGLGSWGRSWMRGLTLLMNDGWSLDRAMGSIGGRIIGGKVEEWPRSVMEVRDRLLQMA
jgi:hypothetical protein